MTAKLSSFEKLMRRLDREAAKQRRLLRQAEHKQLERDLKPFFDLEGARIVNEMRPNGI